MSGPVLSAGVVIVRPFDSELRYLLLRAHRYWDFPKGLVDPGEEPLAAAIREVEEETNLTGLEFRWGERFHQTPLYGRGKVARYFVAVSTAGDVELPPTEELGHPEHDEFLWLDYTRARALLGERVRDVLDWAHAVISTPQTP